MSNFVTFPKLGLEMEINSVALSIGNFQIYWYGILFALGFAVGLWYFYSHSARVGIHPYDGIDIILWAVIGGMIGARVYYVAFEWEYYSQNLSKIFALREGGLAIYGGFLGAVIVGYIACRIKKLPIMPALDAGLPGLMIAQAIGRWGNFFNQEAFGGNTSLPWGMLSNTTVNYLYRMQDALAAQGMNVIPTDPVHPTFLYESLWNVIGFLVIVLVLNRRRRFDGEAALFYISWYGLGRTFIEGLRTDSLMWGSVRVSQALGAVLFVAGAAALLLLRRKYSAPKPAAATPAASEVIETVELLTASDTAVEVIETVGEAPAKPAGAPLYCLTDESIQRMAKVEAQLAEEKAKKAAKKKAGADKSTGSDTDANAESGELTIGIDPADAAEEEYPSGVIEEDTPKEED